jgi:hypothetical protein
MVRHAGERQKRKTVTRFYRNVVGMRSDGGNEDPGIGRLDAEKGKWSPRTDLNRQPADYKTSTMGEFDRRGCCLLSHLMKQLFQQVENVKFFSPPFQIKSI